MNKSIKDQPKPNEIKIAASILRDLITDICQPPVMVPHEVIKDE